MATLASAAPSPTFTPALRPAPGVTSNPAHPASLVHLADIAVGICLPLITTFFGMRLYVRAFLKRVWIVEDYLVTIAWAGTVAYCGILRATMSNHGGQHGWDITPDQAHQAAYWFNVAAIEYGVMIGITKIAVLCLYRRVFSPIRWSLFDIAIVSLIVLMVGFYGITSFFKIFECSPREKIWNKSIPGTCVQLSWILNISGGFNTVTDFLILFLPVHAVRKLQMTRLKKVLVVLAFTFGLCAPIFATIGFVVRLRNSGNLDKSWKQPEILLWGAAELASGNLCVCFPEVTALFRKKHRKSSSGPRRPTASELKGWNEHERSNRSKKIQSDPYMARSLMSTTQSTDSPYIELNDRF
ncbi:putative integral membrane protein [Melanomma pulvis-pyrius CBS 109.77]|uniref:Putative integral membrane protein n=1 Tax=Melanomma pulvis-pyrius CBS 109.77 TaxID=1314802 RepID=A0A6A6XLX3_9PLEO|nr:putative integral membrane protein [Melanomma pulvis-pyrius CBS 109.77]